MEPLNRLMMFSPDVYRATVSAYNEAAWSVTAVAYAVGIIALARLATGHRLTVSTVYTAVAAMWLWVGFVFLAGYYGTIDWSANGVAAVFLVEGVLLMRYAWSAAARAPIAARGMCGIAGIAWCAASMLLGPLSALAGESTFAASAYFGTAPQTVVWLTLGVALMTPRPPWPMLVLMAPAAVATALTALGVGDRPALGTWVVFAASSLAIPLSARRRRPSS
ncbi:MAG: hypothetical protein DWQ08_01270 [Proteobacteria bacterium]|nr:MAG: hypothetical protein DWQ08_01270 [Pseudomonadota bacterium]